MSFPELSKVGQPASGKTQHGAHTVTSTGVGPSNRLQVVRGQGWKLVSDWEVFTCSEDEETESPHFVPRIMGDGSHHSFTCTTRWRNNPVDAVTITSLENGMEAPLSEWRDTGSAHSTTAGSLPYGDMGSPRTVLRNYLGPGVQQVFRQPRCLRGIHHHQTGSQVTLFKRKSELC